MKRNAKEMRAPLTQRFFINATAIFFLWALPYAVSQAELIDKVVADIDGQTITLSDIQSIQKNFETRRRISTVIYPYEKATQENIVETFVNSKIVHKYLMDSGYNIQDAHVEDEIKMTEKNLHITHEQLKGFLKQNELPYEDYFEIMRSSIELNMFNAKTIAPRINISDQQIKNAFYEKNKYDDTLTFEYDLNDYTLPTGTYSESELAEIRQQIQRVAVNQITPEALKDMVMKQLQDLKENSLQQTVLKELKKSQEGELSLPILINNQYHFFWIKRKELVESEKYKLAKDSLKQELFEKEMEKITKIWIEKEKEKHHITLSLN